MQHRNKQMQQCIELCQACQEVCEETLYGHCLEMGGEHVEKEHVKLMMDCIEACQTAANFMKRGSQMHMYECAACAQICEVCAQSCEEIGGKEMKLCARICYRCAQSCREMSQMRMAA